MLPSFAALLSDTFIKKEFLVNFWCPRPDSNRHVVAHSGF